MARIGRSRTISPVFPLLCLLVLGMPACDSGSSGGGGKGTRDLPPLVFMADKDVLGTIELYLSSDAGDQILKISGPMVAGGNVIDFQVSHDGDSVAYLAD